MPLLDLLDQTYLSKSQDQNQALLSNMYLEPDPAKGKYKMIALPTPGLTLFCDTGETSVRALYRMTGITYAVAGSHLYSISSIGVATQLGTLNTSSGFAKIKGITGASDSNHQLFIIDGVNGYSYNIGSNTFITVTNTTFVNSVLINEVGTNYSNPIGTITDATGTGATVSVTASAGAGQISLIVVLQSGTGYTSNPTVTINDSTGIGATASASVSNGIITAITIDTPGYNYSAPTVSITGGSGSGATAAAIIQGGQLIDISVLTAGKDYTAPTIAITDSTGSGGSATVNLETNSFPNTAQDIENQDDYIIAPVGNGSIQFYISDVTDTTTWNPLNFDSKTGQPDGINAVLSHEARLWFFGSETTEVWNDVGDSGADLFPFQRDSTVFLHYGCPAKESIGVNGNYFIFLSSNGKGGYSVFQTLPRIYYYNPAPVSTPYIDSTIGTFSTISDAKAWIYNKDGHEFYELTFPTANQTFVYDIPKKQQADQEKGAWYIRESYNGSSYGRFLGNCQTFCYGKNLIGDYSSGKIYYQDDSNFTENGTPIRRRFVSPPGPTYQGGKRVIVNRLQIDVETGVGNNETFTLEKSLDNGNTWVSVNTYTIPPKGGRIYANGLGSTRYGMIFRITTTMNAKFIILGFQVEASICHS